MCHFVVSRARRSFPTRRSSDLEDCIDSTVFTIELRPLSAASIVLIPLDIESSRLAMSDARLFSDAAVKKLVGLSSADRKSTRLNSSHLVISYAVFCLKKKNRLD